MKLRTLLAVAALTLSAPLAAMDVATSADVRDALAADVRTSGQSFAVSVDARGVATVFGSVNDRSTRQDVTWIVQRVEGVTGLVNLVND